MCCGDTAYNPFSNLKSKWQETLRIVNYLSAIVTFETSDVLFSRMSFII